MVNGRTCNSSGLVDFCLNSAMLVIELVNDMTVYPFLRAF
jgi:hypothetical protein